MAVTPCRILCVEDDEDSCFMLKALFETWGYEVTTAGGVEAALRLIRPQSFDLFILDNRFADGSGVDLCRRIRAADPQTPIVFYSGAALEADRERGLGAGAQAYVIKPDIDGLLAAVKELLEDERCVTVNGSVAAQAYGAR